MPVDMTTLGVTDEAIAVRASADFFLICPKDQRLADGDDGAFSPSGRWSMASASADFAAQGVALGSVFRLSFPVPAAGARPARAREDVVAVESCSGGTVAFRRKGEAGGRGVPPGPAAGASAVAFECPTVLPQVRDVAARIRQRFGVGSEADLRSPADFEIAVIFEVLADLYLTQARMAGDDVRDSFVAKYKLYKAEFESARVRLDAIYAEETTRPYLFSGAVGPARDLWSFGDGRTYGGDWVERWG